MPDIWTKHPEIALGLLKEGGFTCGVSPRVLKDRDPAWTCIINGKQISGDLYIHHINELRMDWTLAGILLLLGIFAAWIISARKMARTTGMRSDN
jgi:hypothetical protein